MTLDEALAADREGRTQDAAAAYERCLLSQSADVTPWINLVVLYWQTTDFGACDGTPTSGLCRACGETNARVDRSSERAIR